MSRRKKRFENVEIIDLGHKGKGIGRKQDGEIILVDKVVPGDRVDVIAKRKKKGIWLTAPTTWHHYSEDREEPFCEHFGSCGGCKWQNLSYPKQLFFKEKSVRDSLERLGGLTGVRIDPIMPSPQTVDYRNKMEFSFSNKRWITDNEKAQDKVIDRKNALGLHPPQFFDKVVDINHCYLQESKSNDIRNFIRDYTLEHDCSYYDTYKHQGLMRSLTIRRGVYTDEWMVNFSFGQEDEKIFKICNALSDQFSIDSINYCINTKKNESTLDLDFHIFQGPGYITEKLDHCIYRIGPKSFFQTNSVQAKEMFGKIKSFANEEPVSVLYDLYCGTGSIGLYLAGPETKVIGIEQVEEAIIQARLNKEINKIEQAHFEVADVKNLLDVDFINKHGAPDLIVVDPPRAGLHQEVTNTLNQIKSPRIIYVSCNPSTQARDLKILNENYEIIRNQPVDLFPHTHHTENISLLKLKDGI